MLILINILLIALGVAALVCWIMTLIKLFQHKETLMGILSICPLVGFIMGWVKAKEYNHSQVMLVWTGAIVCDLILRGLMMAMGGGQPVG